MNTHFSLWENTHVSSKVMEETLTYIAKMCYDVVSFPEYKLSFNSILWAEFFISSSGSVQMYRK